MFYEMVSAINKHWEGEAESFSKDSIVLPLNEKLPTLPLTPGEKGSNNNIAFMGTNYTNCGS